MRTADAACALLTQHARAHRYISHFRAIHRGAYFAQLRTTAVRKLLPESWGFLCPVHTPDGAPCGLLSHLTAACAVVAAPPESAEDAQQAVAQVGSLYLEPYL
jgi:DNA-directed RNA polymerase I subunit RPA2